MIERAIFCLVGGLVALSLLAELSKLIPTLTVICVLIIVARLVFYFTGRDRW